MISAPKIIYIPNTFDNRWNISYSAFEQPLRYRRDDEISLTDLEKLRDELFEIVNNSCRVPNLTGYKPQPIGSKNGVELALNYLFDKGLIKL